MTQQQLIQTFQPENLRHLTEEEKGIMRELNDDEIAILAEAYPNTATRKSYIKLYDKNLGPDKQLGQPSTWQSLRNVRKFANMKNLIPYDFFEYGASSRPISKPVTASIGAGKRVTVDLSAQQAADELRASLQTPDESDKGAKGSPRKAGSNKGQAALEGVQYPSAPQESGNDNGE